MKKENTFFVAAQVFATLTGFFIIGAAMFNTSMFNTFSLLEHESDDFSYYAERCLDENETNREGFCDKANVSYSLIQSISDIWDSANRSSVSFFYGGIICGIFSMISLIIGAHMNKA